MDTGIIGRPGNENDLVAVLHALSITAADLVGVGIGLTYMSRPSNLKPKS